MVMATVFRLFKGGAVAKTGLRTAEHVEAVRRRTGRTPRQDVLEKFLELGREDIVKLGILVDVLQRAMRGKEAVRLEQSRDHDWLVNELRKTIAIEEKLKLIANHIHINLDAKVVITFKGQVITSGDNSSIGDGSYIVKASRKNPDNSIDECLIQIFTKGVDEASRALFRIGPLIDHAGMVDFQIIQASGYDSNTGMMTKQLLDDIIRDHIRAGRTMDGKEHQCYCIAIKFDTNNHPEQQEMLIKNILKVLKRTLAGDIGIAHYDMFELRFTVFDDYKRMRALYDKLDEVIGTLLEIRRNGSQIIPDDTRVVAMMAKLGTDGKLEYQELKF